MSKLAILLVMVVNAMTAFANENQNKITLFSQYLSEPRDILVRLPKNYDAESNKQYPVLFTLNDQDNFSWANYIVALQASRFGIEDMIVIGLPHTGQYTRDNYPFLSKQTTDLSPQAQNYTKFIIDEAIPLIDKKYRTNHGRFIIGHSLSGLFVTQLFMQHPSMFSSFFILSPSLHHAPQMIDLLASYFEKNKTLSGQVYLSIGALEHQKIQQAYSKIEKVFKDKAPRQLRWSVEYMQHTDHMLAAFNGTYDALKWVYSDYTIIDKKLESMQVDKIIEHYQDFSLRMKYEIKPRLRHMIGFAKFIVKETGNVDAGIRVLSAAHHFYPTSSDITETLEQMSTSSNGLKP